MNKKIIGLVICTLLIAILVPTTTLSTEIKSKNPSNNLSINDSYEQKLLEIQKEIKEKNANWTAGYTTVFGPNAEFEPCSCGVIDEEQPEDENTPIEFSGPVPSEWDWRNVDGKNWVTPIKSQGGCGSCVAFGALSALEAVTQIEKGEIFDCDLSEAFLFFCGGGSSCDQGMYLSSAPQYILSTGVPDELCFPYKPYDMPCGNRAQNWINRVIKASNGEVSGSSIKNALAYYGPVLTRFDVYEDFQAYTGGIYEHVSGAYEAGHAVAIVGYNDNPGYWICKNSWGEGWGEDGYFRIKYQNCGIGETGYYFHTVKGNIQPFAPTSPHPLKGETNVDLTTNLSWTLSTDLDGDTVYYTVYFSEGTSVDDKDVIANKIVTPSFIIPDLKYNTKYSWKIVAEDEQGSQNGGVKWQFSTRVPNKPIVNGTLEGKMNKKYAYQGLIPDTDTGGQQYYWFFDWGDDTDTGWIGPYGPYDQVSATHSWTEENQYIIKVRYKVDSEISDWATLTVSMPKTYSVTPHFFMELLQRYLPSLFHFK